MTTLEITHIIAHIQTEIEKCNNVMNAIIIASKAELPEQLTGISAKSYEEQHKARKKLYDYLNRIEILLNSANEYIKNNLL